MNTLSGSKIRCLISNIIVCIFSIVLTCTVLKCGHNVVIDTSYIDSLQVVIDSLSNRKDSIDLQIDTVTVQLEKVKVKYEKIFETIHSNTNDANYKFFSEYIERNKKRLDSISKH